MKLNTVQRQVEDFERRVEALKMLDRAMIANKRLADPDVTIEGCTLIWNTALPLLKSSAREHAYKPLLLSSWRPRRSECKRKPAQSLHPP